MCLYVFPTLLKEFRRHHPDVDIKVMTGGTPRLVRKLRSGAADLGLMTLPIDDSTLAVVPVIREELLLAVPRGHKLAGGKSIPPSALVRQPFILFESGSNTRRVIEEFFVRNDIKPRIVAETENVEIIKSMVASGLGVSILPFQSVARETRGGSTVAVADRRTDAGAGDRVGPPAVGPRAADGSRDDGYADAPPAEAEDGAAGAPSSREDPQSGSDAVVGAVREPPLLRSS